MIDAVAAAAVAFVATNVDDVVLLAILFARRDDLFRTRHIVLGQYAGFVVLVAASAGVAAGLLALPEIAIAALGLIPIALGARALLGGGEDDDDAPVLGARLGTGAVVGITVANGADNVAIYAPLFAASGPADALVMVAVFLVLVAPLCAAGAYAGSRPAIERAVERAGPRLVPVVFILIGVFVIATAL